MVSYVYNSQNNHHHLFDIKTAKPNKGGFKEYKRTLLEWVACVLADHPKQMVKTYDELDLARGSGANVSGVRIV